MEKKLYKKSEVEKFILEGKVMLLSGSDKALQGLPKGKWIAGTDYYFMDGVGKIDDEMIFVDDFTDFAIDCRILSFDQTDIHNIASESFENGFTLITIPIDSPVYFTFSNNSLTYKDIYKNPVVGFVSCILLEDLGVAKSKTAIGTNPVLSETKAAVMHIKLSDKYTARAEIMNFDIIDRKSSVLKFPINSFVQSDCIIDGKEGNIADFLNDLKNTGVGVTPLITNMNGAFVNRDIRFIDNDNRTVSFFSPVYEGDEYRMSKSPGNYLETFNKRLSGKENVAACFSCTSYFLGGNFEGHKIDYNGIYAFGEIAYQLLNKTIVTLEIDEI